jgi:hypothetical protein
MENLIYLTPDAIREHFLAALDNDPDDTIAAFVIQRADNDTVTQIGTDAYWDESIWEAYDNVVRRAAEHHYKEKA